MNKPVVLIVDDDPQVLAAVRRDLRSRYRENYTVMSAASGAEALSAIRELKSRGDALAILISDQRMPGMNGSEVLAQSREFYPLARRVLLTAYSDIEAAVKAINEAHLDHYLSKPWDPPEERLFPAVDDLLDAWQAESLPEAKGLRLVGHQWSPQSHAIKDFLASNLIGLKIQGSQMKIHPAFIIILTVLGAYFAGILGFIIVLPLTMTILGIFKYLRDSVRDGTIS